MKWSIWGVNRFGRPNQCFATYVPPSEVNEYIARAEKEGWTELQVNKNPQPMLFGEDYETPESDSSARVQSRAKRKARSSTSDDASP